MKVVLGLIALAGMFVSATLLNRHWESNPVTAERILEGMPTQELHLMIALAVSIVIVLYLAFSELRRARRRRL